MTQSYSIIVFSSTTFGIALFRTDITTYTTNFQNNYQIEYAFSGNTK